MTTPFDFVTSITYSKKDLFDEDPLAAKAYVPYIINRALSYFPDTLFYANEINRNAHLQPRIQFLFFLNSIRKARRFSKWIKQEAGEDLLAVQQFFGYNTQKAKQALLMLTQEQVKFIKTKIAARGEINDNIRKYG